MRAIQMINKLMILLIGCLLFRYACTESNAEPNTFRKSIGEIKYEVSAMPLQAYKNKNKELATQTDVDFNDYIFIKLKLAHADNAELIKWNCSSDEEYNQRIMFFNSQIKEHVMIKANEQEYYPIECIYENSYGISPHIDVVMVFKNPAANNVEAASLQFILDDIIFSKQIIKLNIKSAI
jgi:hypothetical protein